MAYTETTTETAARFISQWRDKDPNRIIAELISLSAETHRYKDCYHFEYEEGILTDPETKKPIKNFTEKNSYLGRIEYKIVEDIERWLANSEEGIAVWASSDYKGIYPCSKVIIHQIAYSLSGQKVLLNTAILLDSSFKNPEELRKKLFTMEDSDGAILKTLSWIKEISGQSIDLRNSNQAISQKAEYFAEKIAAGISPSVIVEEMQKSQFLGNYSISCPPSLLTFGQQTLKNSFTINLRNTNKENWEWHYGDCVVPGCNRKNVLVGPCGVCKEVCQAKFDAQDASLAA